MQKFRERTILFPDFFQKVAAGPFWSKPLWDSDKDNDGSNDGFLGAPNIMTIAKIAVSVAGGGPWLSFALDAFDTAYNVAAGNMSLKDGAKGLAKGAAITAVSSIGVGKILGGAVGNTIANAGLGSVTASVASSMVNSYSTSLINSAINSIEFDGGLSFNSKKFRQGARDGVKGMAQAGLTALVSSSIMSAGGARWSNGRMGFTDKVGGDIDFAQSWQDSILSVGNTMGALAGQAFSAAMGDGFTLNYKGVLQLQLGGKNSGFSVGGGGVGIGDIANMIGDLRTIDENRDSKEVQFLLNNHNSSEGMARLTYANMGLRTGNMDAMQTSWDIINGDKSLVFDQNMQAGHFGHAGIDNNQIQMNADAINISEKTLGKAGFYTSVMAREGFLIDQNKALGLTDSKGPSVEAARQLTLNAFEMQSGVLGDISKNMGIKFDGEYGALKTLVDYVAKSGDLSGHVATGRDYKIRPEDMVAENIFRNNDPISRMMLRKSKDAFRSAEQIKSMSHTVGGHGSMMQKIVASMLMNRLGDPETDNNAFSDAKNALRDVYKDVWIGNVEKTGDNIKQFALNMLESKREVTERDGVNTHYTMIGANTILQFQDGSWNYAQKFGQRPVKVDVLYDVLENVNPEFFKLLYDFSTAKNVKEIQATSLYRYNPAWGTDTDPHFQGAGIDIGYIKSHSGETANYNIYTGATENSYTRQIRDWLNTNRDVDMVADAWKVKFSGASPLRSNNRTTDGHRDHLHFSMYMNSLYYKLRVVPTF